MTITQIQRLYPTPVIGNNANVHGYCVGGAICLAHAEEGETPPQFPSERYLADMLHTLNPALRATDAEQSAIAIMNANDTGNFHHAWRLAALALGETTTV